MMNVSRHVPQSVFNIQSQNVVDMLKGKDVGKFVYPHQVEAVLAARAQLQDPTRPSTALVVLPTGCGKTGVAVLTAYALNATRVLVVTPSVKISEQIHEAFCGSDKRSCFLVERGLVTEDEVDAVCPSGQFITQTSMIRQCKRDYFMVVNAHKIGGKSKVKIEDIPGDNYDLVIVDEAHHYPADTWRLLVDHFHSSRRLFITATPLHNGVKILDHEPCFELSRREAIDHGVVRPIKFDEATGNPSGTLQLLQEVVIKVRKYLDEHDRVDSKVKHQAMVLAKSTDLAKWFGEVYNFVASARDGDCCEAFISRTHKSVLEEFEEQKIRTLAICGRLREGFDNRNVSVVAIIRNIARSSKVFFTQFVGRAVRKKHPKDPVTAMIISHQQYNQRENFEQFDKVTEDENEDEDIDED